MTRSLRSRVVGEQFAAHDQCGLLPELRAWRSASTRGKLERILTRGLSPRIFQLFTLLTVDQRSSPVVTAADLCELPEEV